MRTIVLAVIVALAPAADAAGAHPDKPHRRESVVLTWNEMALDAVRRTRPGPTVVARALAIVHTCMYDAGAAYDPRAVGSHFGGSLRRPLHERSLANKQEAVSFAAYRALADLFPSEQPLFDALMTKLGYDPLNMSIDTSTPAGVGNVTCAAVLSFRHRDGSNQLGDLSGGAPYSDYTGYVPVNTPAAITDPNRWQPITFANGQAPGFLTPHWGLVTPFAARPGDGTRPPAPALFPSDRYIRQSRALLRTRATLTDRQKAISEYWSDGPSSETPPGHWNLFAQVVSRRDRHSLDEDLRLFFALNNALLDASIGAWECKRFYDYVRPITAIRFLFDPAWTPYQPGAFLTPPFPEYVSGHSTFSAAAAEVLKRFTGKDSFRHAVTLAPGSSRIEPGQTPRRSVTLHWPTFSAAADQAGMSRRFGGIHFEGGDLAGRALGSRIGRSVWWRARSLFDGTAGKEGGS